MTNQEVTLSRSQTHSKGKVKHFEESKREKLKEVIIDGLYHITGAAFVIGILYFFLF